MRILIIVICIIALAATIGAIIVGKRSFEGLVVEKPYETGLAWDETRNKQTNLGWTVSVQGARFKTGKNELIVKVVDKSRSLLTDAAVSVTVSRSSTREYDKTYRTIEQSDGRYHASISLPLYGSWDLIIDVSRKNDHSIFKEAIFAEQGVK
ncbi:MAG TPA: FixH family protein [Nitrospirota bacterium]|nr:FixH family protein [Nitrospirota bacterium]